MKADFEQREKLAMEEAAARIKGCEDTLERAARDADARCREMQIAADRKVEEALRLTRQECLVAQGTVAATSEEFHESRAKVEYAMLEAHALSSTSPIKPLSGRRR